MLRSIPLLAAFTLLMTIGMVGCNRPELDLDETSEEVGGAEAAAGLSGLDAIAKEDATAHTNSYEFDFSLPSTEGETVAKEDFAGRVLIVDIWGTWCPPCRAEVPHFVELQQEYEDQGLSIVGINYEGASSDEEAIGAIAEFTAEVPVNYPLLLGDEATQEQVPQFSGYPTTLFIDRTGKVRMTVLGARPKGELEAIVKILLAEQA